MTEERESDKKVIGGPGITAGGNVTFGDVSGRVAIGENITQLSTSDKKELLDSLIEFQKEIAKLGLPADELSTVNGDVTATINEAKKEKSQIPLKSRVGLRVQLRRLKEWAKSSRKYRSRKRLKEY